MVFQFAECQEKYVNTCEYAQKTTLFPNTLGNYYTNNQQGTTGISQVTQNNDFIQMDLKLPRGVNLLLSTGIQYKYFWSWLSDRTKSASSSQGGFVLFLGLLPSAQGWAVRPTALWVLYWSRTRLSKFTDLTYTVWPTYVQPVLGSLPSSWLGTEAGNTCSYLYSEEANPSLVPTGLSYMTTNHSSKLLHFFSSSS